jgi:hypothetical protein
MNESGGVPLVDGGVPPLPLSAPALDAFERFVLARDYGNATQSLPRIG